MAGGSACFGGNPVGPGSTTCLWSKLTVAGRLRTPPCIVTFCTPAVPAPLAIFGAKFTPRPLASAFLELSVTTYHTVWPWLVPRFSGKRATLWSAFSHALVMKRKCPGPARPVESETHPFPPLLLGVPPPPLELAAVALGLPSSLLI